MPENETAGTRGRTGLVIAIIILLAIAVYFFLIPNSEDDPLLDESTSDPQDQFSQENPESSLDERNGGRTSDETADETNLDAVGNQSVVDQSNSANETDLQEVGVSQTDSTDDQQDGVSAITGDNQDGDSDLTDQVVGGDDQLESQLSESTPEANGENLDNNAASDDLGDDSEQREHGDGEVTREESQPSDGVGKTEEPIESSDFASNERDEDDQSNAQGNSFTGDSETLLQQTGEDSQPKTQLSNSENESDSNLLDDESSQQLFSYFDPEDDQANGNSENGTDTTIDLFEVDDDSENQEQSRSAYIDSQGDQRDGVTDNGHDLDNSIDESETERNRQQELPETDIETTTSEPEGISEVVSAQLLNDTDTENDAGVDDENQQAALNDLTRTNRSTEVNDNPEIESETSSREELLQRVLNIDEEMDQSLATQVGEQQSMTTVVVDNADESQSDQMDAAASTQNTSDEIETSDLLNEADELLAELEIDDSISQVQNLGEGESKRDDETNSNISADQTTTVEEEITEVESAPNEQITSLVGQNESISEEENQVELTAAVIDPKVLTTVEPEVQKEMVPPTFDTVRVDNFGTALVAGRAEPDTGIEVLVNQQAAYADSVGSLGQFAAIFEVDTSLPSLEIALKTITEDGREIMSEQSVIVLQSDFQSLGTGEEDLSSDVAAEPEAATAGIQPLQPAVLLASNDGIKVMQQALPALGSQRLVELIYYDESGEAVLAGHASSFTGIIRIYVDNAFVKDVEIQADNSWLAALDEVEPGQYLLRVDEIGENGDVVARVEMPFQKEGRDFVQSMIAAAETSMTGQSGVDTAPVTQLLTVQPGYTLWGISRTRFGLGRLYVNIFDLNKDQIRDPDLIFPGQIFKMPGEDRLYDPEFDRQFVADEVAE